MISQFALLNLESESGHSGTLESCRCFEIVIVILHTPHRIRQTRMACKYIWGEVKELNGDLDD